MDKTKWKEKIYSYIPTMASILDSINLSGIYSSYTSQVLLQSYLSTLQFIYLPFTFACSIVYAIFAWRTARLTENRKSDGSLKTGYVVPAVVNTVSALLLGTAVVLTCVAAVKFGMVSSLFFGANLALNSIYYLGASLYYAGKAKATPDDLEMKPLNPNANQVTDVEHEEKPLSKKQAYKKRAMSYAIVGAISTLTATAAFMTVLVGQKIFAWLGIGVGIVGAVLGAVSLTHTIRNEWKKSNAAVSQANDAILQDGAKPAVRPDVDDTLDIVSALVGHQQRFDVLSKESDRPSLRRVASDTHLALPQENNERAATFVPGKQENPSDEIEPVQHRLLRRSAVY